MILSKRTLKKLQRESMRPHLYEQTTNSLWTDPYVSKHVLNAHLDPSSDDATRKWKTVRRSAEWISLQAGGGSGRRLLDLGCGPGLYCGEFYRHGFEVTGIDYSEVSIKHARKTAEEEGILIDYIHDDFLTMDLPGGFDVVTMIYGAFCVLSNRDRDLLLWKLRSLLKPDGLFIFDVFTSSYKVTHKIKPDWYVQSTDGFWSPLPHLVLEQSYDYPEDDVYLNQYFVLAAGKAVQKFHIWHHYYTRQDICELIESHNLSVKDVYSDLTGAPFDEDGDWIGLVCVRDK